MRLSRRTFNTLPLIVALSGCGGNPTNNAAPVAATAAPTPTLPATAPLAEASLAQALQGRLPFGSAVTPAQLADPAIAAFIKHHFNLLVAENVMKQEALSPRAEGQYEFSEADALVKFGLDNGMKVRGHTLVWHHQTAPWMLKEGAGEVSRATLIARLERYVTDVVKHFKGRVYAWDVVNEAYQFDEAGTETGANGMRMSPWWKIIGPEYIEIAFRAAAAADPDALLFYNDYETQNPKKVTAMLAMVRDLRSKGVKIDGIGHQMHCARAWPNVADVDAAIDRIAAAGLQQHMTELDIALNQNLADTLVTEATPALLQAQAQRYRELVGLFLRKRDKVGALLVWGISDAYTWLTSWPQKRFEAPLLFDAQLKPKPAYFAVIDVARTTP
jgi:endo-1,4-beta-xylanase